MADAKITRGTTPTVAWHIADESLDFSTIDNIRVIFYSLSKTITKEMDSIEVNEEERYIYVYLSQEETFSLNTGRVDVQLRVHIDDGSDAGQSLATSIKPITIQPILEEQVMTKYERSETGS